MDFHRKTTGNVTYRGITLCYLVALMGTAALIPAVLYWLHVPFYHLYPHRGVDNIDAFEASFALT